MLWERAEPLETQQPRVPGRGPSRRGRALPGRHGQGGQVCTETRGLRGPSVDPDGEQAGE